MGRNEHPCRKATGESVEREPEAAQLVALDELASADRWWALLGRAIQHEEPAQEDIGYHLVASSIALISWWLEHGMPYPPERMGAIYSELVVHPPAPSRSMQRRLRELS